jgi:hypothetical protein
MKGGRRVELLMAPLLCVPEDAASSIHIIKDDLTPGDAQ